jgi:23S rRNA (guanosine2251-2'-O)-methyltransferase
MVGRRSKSRVSRKASGNAQRVWIWGRHLVLETLAAGRWPVQELRFANDLPEAEARDLVDLATAARVPLVLAASPDSLSKQCAKEDHQGYVARMGPFPYTPLAAGLESVTKHGFGLVLDGIQDPFNFGAILRSAEVFGVDAVFVGHDQQAGVTPHVARASSGAVNRLSLVQTNLEGVLRTLGGQGLQIIGASEKAAVALDRCDLRAPTALVIGNEGRGLRPEVTAACTTLVRIPQHGQINSLNAAAAAAVLLYEARRQRSG